MSDPIAIAVVRDLASRIADPRERRQYIGNCSGPESARTVPFDTGRVHGPRCAGHDSHSACTHAIGPHA